MKTLLLSIPLFIVCVSVKGKSDTISNDSIPERQYTQRNEIYLNISPALVPMMGGSSELICYSLKYKRRDKSLNHAVRFGLNYIKTYDPISYQQYTFDNDSTMVVQKISDANTKNIWGSIGWEFIQYYKKFERFYGSDIILGHYQSHTSIHQDVYTINNNLYNQSYYENINYSYTSTRIGISPFFGLKYHISQYFLFAIQAGVDVTYNLTSSSTSKGEDLSYSTFDFKLGTPSFINDISFVYSF